MSAKIYHISPKGSAWLVYHRLWKGGAFTTNWAFVTNRGVGLTAFEAWQLAKLAGNPSFPEVVTIQLAEYPLSVDTKVTKVDAESAFARLVAP